MIWLVLEAELITVGVIIKLSTDILKITTKLKVTIIQQTKNLKLI